MSEPPPALDPFTGTVEEARAALAQPGGLRPVGAWACAQELIARRAYFEAHPIDGVAKCVKSYLLPPEWLAVAFLRGYYAVMNGRAGSWDAAFGAPYPKGTQLAAVRRRRINRGKVALAVSDAVQTNPEGAIDDEFWESIGRAVGEGKSNAQKLHREAVVIGLAIPIAKIRGGLGWPVRRSPKKSQKLVGIKKRR